MHVSKYDFSLYTTYCKHHNVYGVYVSLDEDALWPDLLRACPPLNVLSPNEMNAFFAHCGGILTFTTQQEMEDAYTSITTVETNPYCGVVRVYACTISNTGEILTENT